MTPHRQQKLKYVAPAVTLKCPYEAIDRPYVGLEHIRSWTGEINLSADATPEGAVTLFESDDILFGKLRPYLAKVALATFRGACSTEALVLRPTPGHLPRYLRYVLSQKQFIDEVDSSTFGAKMPRASWEFIGSRMIPTPDLEIQGAITDFLDRETARINRLIVKKKRFVELLEEKRSLAVGEVVKRGLDSQVPLKDTDIEWIGPVPAHWHRTCIKHLFRQTKRQGHADLTVLSVYREFGVIVKSSRNDNINKTPEDLSVYQLVKPGDLVINKMKAWQGSLGISPYHGITSPDYVILRPIAPHHSKFVHHYLRSQPLPTVYRMMSNGIRPDQWRLEPERFGLLPIFLPSQEEQIKISEHIDRIADGIGLLTGTIERSVDRLGEFRSSLVTAAVTGQIDVATWGKRGETDRRLDRIEEEMSLHEARA